jgi:hypothetical protein
MPCRYLKAYSIRKNVSYNRGCLILFKDSVDPTQRRLIAHADYISRFWFKNIN